MRRIEMAQIKEILRLRYEVGLSLRDISQSVRCSLGTVSSVLQKAQEAGIVYPTELSSKELGSIIYPPVEAKSGEIKPEPDMEYIHREMSRKGVTLQLLWEEYKADTPNGVMYTQFCERYREYRKKNKIYMRKEHKAGEHGEVDWSGLTLTYYEGQEEKEAFFFVLALPSSSLIYSEPYRDMKMSSWIEGHNRAFRYFGGVPKILIPDNTKTAVTKPGTKNEKDPVLNKTYKDMAAFYGTAIIPARPLKPKDKGLVEKGVQIVENRIIAKLRNRIFLSFDELHTAALEELETVNTANFKSRPTSRRELFLAIEKNELLPLPRGNFEYAEYKTCKVAFDYHIEFDEHYYSVSYLYVGKQVEVRGTTRMVEIFCDHERIPSHVRAYGKTDRYITLTEHMPENHKAVSEWSVDRFISWAASFGKQTEDYIRFVMSKREHPEQAYKTCVGILNKGESISKTSMEQICKKALDNNAYSYKYFDVIFKKYSGSESPAEKPIDNPNVRGADYYGGGRQDA